MWDEVFLEWILLAKSIMWAGEMFQSHSWPLEATCAGSVDAQAESAILFAGPRGAGKATAIASVSDTPVIATPMDGDATGNPALDVAPDALVFGQMILPEGKAIRLCGVPDRDITDVRRIPGLRAQGLVLLIDGSARDPVLALERFLDRFADICREGSAVIGITRTDLRAGGVNLRRYRQCVRHRRRMIPIYEIDARDRVQMLVLLAALIEMIRLRATEFDAD